MENEKIIIGKLDVLKAELDGLREHIMNITLTSDDIVSIKEAEEDLRKGKTKRI